MKYSLFILLIITLTSCEETVNDNRQLQREIIFSDDFSSVDIYNSAEFSNYKSQELYWEAIGLIKKHQFKKAKGKLLKADEIEPNSSSILINLGNIAEINSNYDLAIKYYHQSIKNSNSNNIHSTINLGRTYSHMRKFQKSIDILNKVLENSDDTILKVSALYPLTISYAELNSCENSKISFEKFKKLTRDNDDFQVMTSHLKTFALNCGKKNFQQNISIRSDNKDYNVQLTTFSTIDSSSAHHNSIFLNSRVTEIKIETKPLILIKRIIKNDFEDFLYKDFFERSYIEKTEVSKIKENRLFMSSRLKSLDSEKFCTIRYTLKIKKDSLQNVTLERVKYF